MEHRKPKKIAASKGSCYTAAIKGMQVELRAPETVPLSNGTPIAKHLSSEDDKQTASFKLDVQNDERSRGS